MAISGWSIQHRDLVEGGSKPSAGGSREEQDVVLMPIGVSDESAKGIKPLKSARVFIGQTPIISE